MKLIDQIKNTKQTYTMSLHGAVRVVELERNEFVDKKTGQVRVSEYQLIKLLDDNDNMLILRAIKDLDLKRGMFGTATVQVIQDLGYSGRTKIVIVDFHED